MAPPKDQMRDYDGVLVGRRWFPKTQDESIIYHDGTDQVNGTIRELERMGLDATFLREGRDAVDWYEVERVGGPFDTFVPKRSSVNWLTRTGRLVGRDPHSGELKESHESIGHEGFHGWQMDNMALMSDAVEDRQQELMDELHLSWYKVSDRMLAHVLAEHVVTEVTAEEVSARIGKARRFDYLVLSIVESDTDVMEQPWTQESAMRRLERARVGFERSLERPAAYQFERMGVSMGSKAATPEELDLVDDVFPINPTEMTAWQTAMVWVASLPEE